MSNSDLGRFVKQFDDMISNLVLLCPEEKDLKIFQYKFDTIKKVNPLMILLAFLKYIYPYKDKILGTRNDFENFLCNADLHQEINKNEKIVEDIKKNNVDNDLVITKALNMKRLWETRLNENNKDVMFTYFKVLTKLCEKYVINNYKV